MDYPHMKLFTNILFNLAKKIRGYISELVELNSRTKVGHKKTDKNIKNHHRRFHCQKHFYLHLRWKCLMRTFFEKPRSTSK